jgi:hypothetical protein
MLTQLVMQHVVQLVMRSIVVPLLEGFGTKSAAATAGVIVLCPSCGSDALRRHEGPAWHRASRALAMGIALLIFCAGAIGALFLLAAGVWQIKAGEGSWPLMLLAGIGGLLASLIPLSLFYIVKFSPRAESCCRCGLVFEDASFLLDGLAHPPHPK